MWKRKKKNKNHAMRASGGSRLQQGAECHFPSFLPSIPPFLFPPFPFSFTLPPLPSSFPSLPLEVGPLKSSLRVCESGVISLDPEPQPESNLVHFGLKIWHLVYDSWWQLSSPHWSPFRFRRKRFSPEKPIISPGRTDNRLLYQSGPD